MRLANRARGLEQKGDYASAVRDLKEAVSMMDNPADQKSWLFAKITAEMGFLEFARGDTGFAAATIGQALKIERDLGGAGTPPYAASPMALGDALLFGRDATGAEAAYREASADPQAEVQPGQSGDPCVSRCGWAKRSSTRADQQMLIRCCAKPRHFRPKVPFRCRRGELRRPTSPSELAWSLSDKGPLAKS